MSTRRVVGPFNRVEGDLEITLEIAAGRIDAAYVNSPLYRGFEQILQGKMPADALTLVPRICGISSVAQSMASALALVCTRAGRSAQASEIPVTHARPRSVAALMCAQRRSVAESGPSAAGSSSG